jgi:hypothetical protein
LVARQSAEEKGSEDERAPGHAARIGRGANKTVSAGNQALFRASGGVYGRRQEPI